MPDEAAAPAANDTAAPAAPMGGSTGDIASFLTERRKAPPSTEPATPAGGAAEESSSVEDDAAAVEGQPLGETDETDPAGEPPISPPKSWTKAEKDAFASLPREHQQLLADRESERESYYRKGHDEAANEKRAAAAERQAAEQARQQYEQHLPALRDQWQNYAKQTQEQFAQKWSGVQGPADLARLRETDFTLWMEYRDDREAVTQAHASARQADHNAKVAAQNQAAKDHENWVGYAEQEDGKFVEKMPAFKDPKRAEALTRDAHILLTGLGFTPQELHDTFRQGQQVSLRDHRLQLVLTKAVLYDRAEKARKAAQPKPVPPVQRPGVAAPKGEASPAYIRDLTTKAKTTGAPRDIAALLTARRKAS